MNRSPNYKHDIRTIIRDQRAPAEQTPQTISEFENRIEIKGNGYGRNHHQSESMTTNQLPAHAIPSQTSVDQLISQADGMQQTSAKEVSKIDVHQMCD